MSMMGGGMGGMGAGMGGPDMSQFMAGFGGMPMPSPNDYGLEDDEGEEKVVH